MGKGSQKVKLFRYMFWEGNVQCEVMDVNETHCGNHFTINTYSQPFVSVDASNTKCKSTHRDMLGVSKEVSWCGQCVPRLRGSNKS